ncbi:MAG: hypothetical protein LBC79_07850 [Deltaproteobacteria bacterium]|jgi:hypothetical protein|nr:hypothetical protein [Deltaproteobacteria bacterium]
MITPKERAEWREQHGTEPYYYGHRIIRLLDALEAAEARAKQEKRDRKICSEAHDDEIRRRLEQTDRAEQAEAERDVLAEHLDLLDAACPSEWDECPFPDDCRVPPEKFTRCWIAYARQQTQKRA